MTTLIKGEKVHFHTSNKIVYQLRIDYPAETNRELAERIVFEKAVYTLNLPDITVFSYASELDFIILNLQLISDGIDCPNCHHYTDTLHQFVITLIIEQLAESLKD